MRNFRMLFVFQRFFDYYQINYGSGFGPAPGPPVTASTFDYPLWRQRGSR